MAFRLDFSRIQQFDANGAPLSGAKLYVYENGTTTPVSLFSDRAGMNAAANPIVADSTGRFPVRYVAADDLLTFDLDTSADVDVWSDDDMEPVPNTDGALQAANNLDDVADPATALANLGAGELAALDYADLSVCADPKGGADYALIYDVSAAAWKKLVLADFRVMFPFIIAVGDETTAITTGTAKVSFRAPWAMSIFGVKASLTTASSSGVVTVDINESGASILSTKLTIDANEKTSITAATPVVISDNAIAADAEITIDIDAAGTNASGLKVTIFAYAS